MAETAQPVPDDLFQIAAANLSLNNLSGADSNARALLEQQPGHAGALNLVGIVAARLGLLDQAEAAFQKSMAADPAFAAPRDNLARLQTVRAKLQPNLDTGERFLLIKAWGAGFWSEVSQVLGCALLAEMTNRTPIVHWGHNSLFREDDETDAFGLYFLPLSDNTIETVRTLEGAEFFPPKWTPTNLRFEDNLKWEGPGSRLDGLYFLNRPERIAVVDFYTRVKNLLPWLPPSHRLAGQSIEAAFRDLAARYLKPRDSIAAAVAAFHARELAGTKAIAVHVRGADKSSEYGQLDALNESYFPVLDQQDSATRIFLLTDDAHWLTRFRDRYGDHIVTTDSLRSENNSGVHTSGLHNRVRLGTEVAIDAYIALTCDKFLGNGRSNLSAMVAILKDWTPSACTLLATSLLIEP